MFCSCSQSTPLKKGCRITSATPWVPSRVIGSKSSSRSMKSNASCDISSGTCVTDESNAHLRPLHVFLQDAVEDALRRAVVEGRKADKQLVGDGADAPPVVRRAAVGSQQQLRRHVVRRPHARQQVFPLVEASFVGGGWLLFLRLLQW